MKAVRAAIPNARERKVLPFPKPKRETAAGAKRKAKQEEPPPPPPPSWIDQLPTAEGRAVRKLIAAVERDGIADAEELVKRDRDGLLPQVATRRIERRLAAIVDEVPPKERAAAKRLVRRVAELLSGEGTADHDLPGWTLVEIEAGGDEPANRRIDLRE
jgi:hypothetical protein